eukprot:XP_011441985.1 PREDICTED: uncharacterized protein LOC105338517 [Crassostrea gigas]
MGMRTILILLSLVSACLACKSSLYGEWTDDKTQQTVTFSSSGVTGWDVSLFSHTVNTWKCAEESTDQILLSSSPIDIYSLYFVVHRCITVTKETDCKYQITFNNPVEPNAGNERVTVLLKNDDATLSMCSSDGETRTITKNGCV